MRFELRFLILTILTFVATAATAQLLPDLEVKAVRTETPPTIDGDLSDPAWENAPTKSRSRSSGSYRVRGLRFLVLVSSVSLWIVVGRGSSFWGLRGMNFQAFRRFRLTNRGRCCAAISIT